MQAREGTWSEILPMMFIRHPKTGQAWRVEDRKSGWLRISNRAGQVISIAPQDPGKRVILMEMTESEAIELVRRELGGVVIQ